MSALDKLKINFDNHVVTPIEHCIMEIYGINGLEWIAEAAAEELADKDARIAELEKRLADQEEMLLEEKE